MAIGVYYIGAYSYSICGYCWLTYYRPLMVILSMVIDGYSICGY